ncbi:MAG TPA: LptA/OstA family protein [Anaeromyxobacteraceae bacterium]|nr:LptA/OstA family protein [Anaeromyxobacteraceae bacterium]
MALAASAALALLAAPGPSRAERPPVHVDADQVQVLYKQRRVVFVGKPLVRLTREDAVLTCRKLVADNDAQGRIRRAVCTGEVRLTRSERVATCEVATFDAQASTVVCTGNPELRDGKTVMRGEQLTYDLATDQVVMSQVKGTVVPGPGDEPVPPRRARAGEQGGGPP